MNHQQLDNNNTDEPRLPAELEAAWSQVQFSFKESGMAQPLTGFVERWQARLAEQRAIKNKRQAFMILSINWVVVAALVIFLVIQLIPVLPSPVEMVSSWVQDVMSMLMFVKVVISIAVAVIETLRNVIPLNLWFGAGFGACVLVIMWAVTIRQVAWQGVLK